jgi:hypothetical protein
MYILNGAVVAHLDTLTAVSNDGKIVLWLQPALADL